VPDLDVTAYLRRLGLAEPEPPSVGALRRLHQAHVERVPHESLEIQLGRPTTVDPGESAQRIVDGSGGYCFHLNGAFAILLAALGYDVTWHRGWVTAADETRAPDQHPNHLTLTVRGLPAPECPDGVWIADVGLGDALYDPIPLRAGDHRQGPFEFRLTPSLVEPGGWRFRHHPTGSFAAMDFAPEPARPADFAPGHAELSGSPGSPFVRWAIVQRRHPAGADILVGCRLKRLGYGDPVRLDVTTSTEWFAVLADVFGLHLHDVSPAQRRELWSRVWSAHEAASTAEGQAA